MSKEKSSNYLDIKSDIALSISGKSNSNPSSINRPGKTETLWVRTLEPLPNNNLSCHSKSGTMKGLLRALARVLPKYFCWIGFGDVTLYIPELLGFEIIKLNTLIRSLTWIQEKHCLPSLIGPPKPKKYGRYNFLSAPPFLDRTTPNLKIITSFEINFAASSQAIDSFAI
jgi:hypothetical protein